MEGKEYCFYIDETCHLEHDGYSAMCMGYIKVPSDHIQEYKDAIKSIKRKHHLLQEFKWHNVSYTHIQLYKDVIDLFFNSEMEFHSILVSSKTRLDKESFFKGDSDNFYYSMIYNLLYNPTVNDYKGNTFYRVFLDKKDTRGTDKLKKIHTLLNTQFGDNTPFLSMQNIQSHESQFIQIADLFIGAIAHKARGLCELSGASRCKTELIQYLETLSGYTINEGTEPGDSKFSIINYQPKKRNGE